jgi:hypothetical protein
VYGLQEDVSAQAGIGNWKMMHPLSTIAPRNSPAAVGEARIS